MRRRASGYCLQIGRTSGILQVRPKRRQAHFAVSCGATELGLPLKHLRTAKHRALIGVIKAARGAADLTQRELAAKLKRSNSFVWKIEAGERQVNVLEFIEIARALGVKASTLIAEIDG